MTKQQLITLRRALAGTVAAGMLAGSMVTGWAWAVMPPWLRVCGGIAGVGMLTAKYICWEVKYIMNRSRKTISKEILADIVFENERKIAKRREAHTKRFTELMQNKKLGMAATKTEQSEIKSLT